MAQSLLEVKKRISTVESIRKITKAMKLIASSRSTRLKNIYDTNYSYVLALHDAMKLCLQYIDFSLRRVPTCLLKYPGNKKLYIFITSTLGLCGSYNYALEKLAKTLLTKNDDCIFIGDKGFKHFANSVDHAYSEHVNLLEELTFEKTNLFRHYVDSLYKKEIYSEVNIIYTKYINSMVTKPVCERLLPLVELDVMDTSEIKEPIFEGDSSKVTDLIVPHYLDALIYRYFLESKLSEYTCRRNSMDSATSSADNLIYTLKLDYNKIRQQKITQEITEIVGGSNNSSY